MGWNELTNEAKGIIEWIEDPYTGKRRILEIKIGEMFEPVSIYAMKPTRIMITKDLYQEVISFVKEDKNLDWWHFTDGFTFKIKDSSNFKLK